jgi:hypothetical protein
MKRIVFLLAVVGAMACSQSSKTEEGPVSVKIDLEASRSPKEISDFQKRFSIRLLPLETTEDALFGYANRVVVSGETIFILDAGQDAVFRYDLSGRYVGKIYRQGNGPEEYVTARAMAVSDGYIHISDLTQILQYDWEGRYIGRFPVSRTYQLTVNNAGNVLTAGSYLDDYMLNEYDRSGTRIAGYFPQDEKLANFPLTRGTWRSLGIYDGNIYITNSFDPTIYFIKEGQIKPAFTFDFGSNSLPNSIFMGTPEQMVDNFENYRERSVMAINGVTLTDDWVVFSPEFSDSPVVYYDRRTNTYMTNRGFEIPYSTFLGRYFAPHGYTDSGEFYSWINAYELRDMLLELAVADPDYLEKYDFLKGIEPAEIEDNDNAWLVFYTLK